MAAVAVAGTCPCGRFCVFASSGLRQGALCERNIAQGCSDGDGGLWGLWTGRDPALWLCASPGFTLCKRTDLLAVVMRAARFPVLRVVILWTETVVCGGRGQVGAQRYCCVRHLASHSADGPSHILSNAMVQRSMLRSLVSHGFLTRPFLFCRCTGPK